MPESRASFSEQEIVGGNYRILGIAGSGGMGVVYRALDLRLDRVVALKFLPPELHASHTEKERFLREARTASSLDHPNVGVIYGVEETADGLNFISMAFYEGASLAEHIARGSLPVHKAIQIAAQMAQGLAEAHARGIVHRDVKPSNVMMASSGMVKIVDFGLAYVMDARTASRTGTTGTILYMSPEQSMGQPADQRCDIWALGVVLAEMLVGVHPFQRETLTASLFAILNEPPHGIESVHPALQPLLYRALSKDPARRYPCCAEFLDALEKAGEQIPATAGAASLPASGAPVKIGTQHTGSETTQLRRALEDASRSAWQPAVERRPQRLWAWLAAAAATLVIAAALVWLAPPLRQRAAALFGLSDGEKHIAVLPLDVVGSNPESGALADGLMDSLAGRLSNLDVGDQALWVVPNSEVRRRHVTDPADALKALGANVVIKGSVERDGREIRLTLNLIDTRTLRQIGSAEAEDEAGNLSTLENEAVARVAQLMHITVTGDMLHNTGGHVNPAAYEDYLTALGYMQRYDKPGNLDQAIATLKNSIRTDPDFALGYAQLGEAYRLKYRVDNDANWLTEAEADCSKAVELDSHIASVYVTLGRIHDSAGKHDLALEEFQHALNLDAKNPSALAGMAHAYEDGGRVADAQAAYQRAADLRPDDWDGYNNLAMFFDRQGKYPEAIAAYKHALQLTPDNADVLLNLASSYIDAGDPASLQLAEPLLQRSIAISPSYAAWANLGDLYYLQHRFPESAEATRRALRLNAADYNVWDNLRLDCEWLRDASCAQAAATSEIPLLLSYMRSQPRDADASAIYADLAARVGPRDQAEQHIRKALALAPQDATVLEDTADAYQSLGQHELALKYLKVAFEKGLKRRQAMNDPEIQTLLQVPGVALPDK